MPPTDHHTDDPGAQPPPLPVQRELFDIPDDVAYFNCASLAPQLKAAGEAGAAALARRGVAPVTAGVASGVGGFLVVDELANSLFFTPPPQAYPVESHLRGVVGHLTFGAVTGVLLALARRLRLL